MHGSPVSVTALAAPLAVSAVWLSAAILSWRRFGNLFFDGGRELEVPRRLLEGDVLYRDVHWYWGPLGPYLDSAAYAVFGVSSDTLMWLGLATAALACAGLYLLARSVLDPWTSAAVAVAFVFVCAFTQRNIISIFNFVLPFNSSATYGMAAAIWSVHLLLRHEADGRTAPLLGAGILAGVAALTKIEIVLAVGAAHAVYAATSWRTLGRRHAASWGLALGVAATGYGAAWAASGGALWASLTALANPASRFYVRFTMGLRDPAAALREVGLSAVALLLVWAIGLATASLAARSGAPTAIRAGAVVAAGLSAFAMATVVIPDLLFRSMPLAALLVLALLLVARARRGDELLAGRWRAHVVIWTFALASLARIPLRVGPDHYGFFLLAPTLLCLALPFREWVPATLAGSIWGRRALSTAGQGLVLGTAVAALLGSWPYFREPRSEVRTARVHLLVHPRAPENAILARLARLPAGTSVLAVPQGVGMLFAAGFRGPRDGMTSYLPMEIPDRAADARLVERWKSDPPDVVLFWDENLERDFGSAGFGIDYARGAARWLVDNYEPVVSPAPRWLILTRRL